MARAIDILGQKFGRLTVVEFAGVRTQPSGHTRRQWKCVCDCGTENLVILQSSLRSGNSTSCGCFNKEQAGKSASERFESLSKYMIKEYRAFSSAKTRCYNPNVESYADYGARGITVCDEWLGEDGFYKFFDALGPSPDKSFLDRIDPNGNYCPENCRWVTPSMSGFNKRKTSRNTSGRTGISWSKKMGKWKAYIRCITKEEHLGYFDNFDEAVKVREAAELKYFGFIKEE